MFRPLIQRTTSRVASTFTKPMMGTKITSGQQQTTTKVTSRVAFITSTTTVAAAAATVDNKAAPPGVCPVKHGAAPQYKYDLQSDKKYIDAAVKLAPKLTEAIHAVMEDDDYDGYGHYGPLFIRLAWHASGTYDQGAKNGGSNGACMRFNPESGHGANKGLDIARKRLEGVREQFPTISYADLYTFAGKVAADYMLGEGGPMVPFNFGRSDFTENNHFQVDAIRLPDASKDEKHVRQVFTTQMGFNDQEIVALLGAHAVGKMHLERAGYSSSINKGEALPWTYAPTTLGTHYYKTLLEEKWIPVHNPYNNQALQYENEARNLIMLPAEYVLVTDPKFRPYVEMYAKDDEKWRKDFTVAFGKLLELGVEFPQ